MKPFLPIALMFALLTSGARAAEVKIVNAKAFLFWERAGKFSDNILGAPGLENLARGGGANNDTASAVMFDLVFAGDKNSAPKYATATVDVTQSSRTGQAVVTHKAFTNFVFGSEGLEHKAFLMENATCMPMTVEIRSGKTVKVVSLEFSCKD